MSRTLAEVIADEILSDDSYKEESVQRYLKGLTEHERGVIDVFLNHLCGWSLETLQGMVEDGN